MQNFNQILLVLEIDHLNFHKTGFLIMTSQILLSMQVFCPTSYADLAIFKPL